LREHVHRRHKDHAQRNDGAADAHHGISAAAVNSSDMNDKEYSANTP